MKRTIVIATPGTRLAVDLKNLEIQRADALASRIPFEDLDLLILETPACTVTGAALNGVLAHGGAVMICDEKHLPSGLLLPMAASSLVAAKQIAQVEASQALRKNLWRRIVQVKIENQARNLSSPVGARRLKIIQGAVLSGDASNGEAQAARVYWEFWSKETKVFDFVRSSDDLSVNGLLNYGYAILRSTVARALCAAGLNPVLGIHHHHRSNPFALADDLMEPCRPWVDRMVTAIFRAGIREVDVQAKRTLQTLLTEPSNVSGKVTPLGVAIERMAAGLSSCFLAASDAEEMRTAEELSLTLEIPLLPTIGSC